MKQKPSKNGALSLSLWPNTITLKAGVASSADKDTTIISKEE